MTGLAFILADDSPARLAAALETAASAAALGRPVAVLLKGSALRALDHRPLADLLGMLLVEDGAALAVCQTDMDAAGLIAAALPAGVEPLGMVAFLADHADKQLVFV